MDTPPTPDSDVLGTLTPEELQALTSLKAEYTKCLQALGELDVRKHLLEARAIEVDNAAKELLENIKNRIGLSDTDGWAMKPDGSVVRHTEQ